MPKVLISDELAPEAAERLARLFSVDYRPGLTHEELLAAISEYDALLVRSATKVDAEVMRRGERLQIVGRAGVGIDNVDVEEATRRGIAVVNVPDGNTIAATEHTFALILALARHVPDAVSALRGGRWQRDFIGRQLYGKVLGIVGLGRIGREVAHRALSFGMRVVGFDPYLDPQQVPSEVEYQPDLHDVLRQAQILTVHTPLTAQTRHMIGAEELAALPPGAWVVNCARGGIVDEKALLEALDSGQVGGAALDVYETEPATSNPLLRHPHVVATPHLGASTAEAQLLNAVEVADEVIRWFQKKPLKNAVNLPRLSAEEWEQVRPWLLLARILGPLLAQAEPTAVRRVQVLVPVRGRAGDFLADTVLAGLLRAVHGGDVNVINASTTAKRLDVEVQVSQPRADDAERERRLGLRLEGQPGAERREAAGHIDVDGTPRIVLLDGYPIDLVPREHMMISRHRDIPGIVGKVGSVMGEVGVNIAEMRLGRKTVGGEAVMVLVTDQEVDGTTLRRLRDLPDVMAIQAIQLPDLAEEGL